MTRASVNLLISATRFAQEVGLKRAGWRALQDSNLQPLA